MFRWFTHPLKVLGLKFSFRLSPGIGADLANEGTDLIQAIHDGSISKTEAKSLIDGLKGLIQDVEPHLGE